MWELPANSDEEITKVLIYRDTKPIQTALQISKLKPVYEQITEICTYTDTVPDLQNYFYAVIAVTKEPYIFVLPSINASTVGVQTTARTPAITEKKKTEYDKLYPSGNLRETPLPYIDFTDGLKQESPISDEAVNAAKLLASGVNKTKKTLPPYIFEQDLIEPDGSDDYLLFEILKNYFVQRKYSQATIQLKRLIGTNITEETRARANFYLGESQFFQKNYKDSIRTFVKIEGIYPSLANKWIDAALDYIEYPED